MTTTGQRAQLPVDAPTTAVCADCGASMRFAVVCEVCGRLNPSAVNADPFALLGFAHAFNLDASVLATTFRILARRIHPDRFAAASDDEKFLAAQLSAAVNHAYDLLADPVRRADFLLVSAGGPTAAELRDVPGDLLMQTMSLREEIESAIAEGDAVTLNRIREKVSRHRHEALEELSESAKRLPELDKAAKESLRRQMNAMKYHDNLLLELTEDPLKRA